MKTRITQIKGIKVRFVIDNGNIWFCLCDIICLRKMNYYQKKKFLKTIRNKKMPIEHYISKAIHWQRVVNYCDIKEYFTK